MRAYEVNFDGLVGPTHNYSGLSYGNVASMSHIQQVSNPRAAALQGIEKMKMLSDLGIVQAILPPHERPYLPILKLMGYQGTDHSILEQVFHESPHVLYACSSAAAMWTANAATVTPSSDARDGCLHITPANLISKFHRSLEPKITSRILKAIFADPTYFIHHDPLFSMSVFADEGAANHTRFCNTYEEQGIHLFVYGRHAFKEGMHPKKFPSRQTDAAFQSIMRNHQINPENALFVQQNPEAVDAGVFHNDVISVGNKQVFFYHEKAFVETTVLIEKLNNLYREKCKGEMILVEVKNEQVTLEQSVASYLFNSQIVAHDDNSMIMIAPMECRDIPETHALLQKMMASPNNPIKHVQYMNLHESMCNGGGPACLRLRVVMTQEEIKAANPNVFFNPQRHDELVRWVKKHYRDRLLPQDLLDPQLLNESRAALDELTQILNFGSVYDFQQL